MAQSLKCQWIVTVLLQIATEWYRCMRIHRRTMNYRNQWWPFVWSWRSYIVTWMKEFVAGRHQFSPMRQYQFTGEVVRVWEYLDRLIMNLIFRIIRPTFKHIISPLCLHLTGPTAIKSITAQIKTALTTGRFNYCLRIDIRSYYASIDHQILLKQLAEHFDDSRLCHYLENIVTIGVDCNGAVFLPEKGIPLCSTLSPFFGALYLSKLDRVFEVQPGIFYRRYMDDIIILVENKRQYIKARRRLFKILQELKLQVSPHKTRMGALKNGFHFLGVDFEVARTSQIKTQVATVNVHSRTCRRALDKVQALCKDAVHPAQIQCYLSRWATWWKSVIKLDQFALIYRWVSFTKAFKPDSVWFGRGLLLLSPYYCLCQSLSNISNQNQLTVL